MHFASFIAVTLGLFPALPLASTSTTEVIVVTGTRRQQRLEEAVIKSDLIDRSAIEASGARTLAEALEARPGLRLVQDVTGAVQLQLRGFGTDHVLILVDGRRLPGRKNGAIDLSRLGVEEIERIEIVRGPASALYGADALAGVVNVITRRPERGWEASAQATAGGGPDLDATTSPETFTLALQTGGNLDDFSWQVSGAYLNRSAFDLTPDSVGTSGSAIEDFDLNLSGRYEGPDWQLDVRATGSDRTLDAIEGGPILPRGQQAIYDRRSRIQTLGLQIAPALFAGEGTLRGELSVSSYDEVFDRRQRGTDRSDIQNLEDVVAQLLVSYDQPVGDHHLLVGAELMHQDITGDRFPSFQDRTRVSGFLQDDWRLHSSLTVNGGLRLDYDSQFDLAAAPRIAARYEPFDNLVFRASWGLGFKAPLPRDLAILFENPSAGYRVAGNPDLAPERASTLSTEVSYAPLNAVTVSVGAYYSEIEDLIVALPGQIGAPGEPLLFGYGNVARARIMGIEAVAQVQPWRWLRLGVGYDGVEATDLNENRPLPDRSPHRVSGNLGLRFSPLRLDAQLAWTDARVFFSSRDSGEVELFAPAYVRLDTRVAVDLTTGLVAFVGGDNLFNAGDPQLLVIPPRTLFAGVRGTLRSLP